MGFSNKETLCWRCKRAGTESCAWDKSRGNVPVEGWTAEESKIRVGNGVYTKSYRVIDCPLFVLDEDYERRMKQHLGECQKRGVKPKTDIEKIEHFIRYGWTDKAIALQFGLSPETVRGYRYKWRKKQQEQERKGKK